MSLSVHFHSLGALSLEQDLDRGEDDTDILGETGVGDVHQVHLQFIVGRGIVLAVDLGVAGEAGLGLKAKTEFREFFFIFLEDLGALRAGADNGHIAAKDVDELRDLVDAEAANTAPDGGDAFVIAAGEPRHAVLFGVFVHAAEFQQFEGLAFFCQALLPEQGGAAVASDQQGHNEHDRR